MDGKRSIDSILDEIGLSRYQVSVLMILNLMEIPASMQTLLAYFLAQSPTWRCTKNSTTCQLKGDFSPYDSVYNRRCDLQRSEWEYSRSKFHSATTQFDLVCKDEGKAYLLTSVFFVGLGIGSLPMGWLSDRFGRCKTLALSMLATLSATFAGGFSTSFVHLMICRATAGLFYPGIRVNLFVLGAEMVGTSWRSSVSLIKVAFSICGELILVLTAYLIQDWRSVMIISSVPYAIPLTVVCFTRFLPESIRWLQLNGQEQKAQLILNKIGKSKGLDIENTPIMPPLDEQKKRKVTSPKLLFKPLPMLMKTLAQSLIWLLLNASFYGILLATDDLTGSMYRDLVLLTLVGLFSCGITMWACTRFGRKRTVQGSLAVTAISCFAVAFIPFSRNKNGFLWLRLSMGIIGKLTSLISLSAVYLWSAEIFPTFVRSQGMSVMQISARLGGASSPWISKGLGAYSSILPFAVMGTIASLAALVSQLMPETKGIAIKENIDKEEKEQLANQEMDEENSALSGENKKLETNV